MQIQLNEAVELLSKKRARLAAKQAKDGSSKDATSMATQSLEGGCMSILDFPV